MSEEFILKKTCEKQVEDIFFQIRNLNNKIERLSKKIDNFSNDLEKTRLTCIEIEKTHYGCYPNELNRLYDRINVIENNLKKLKQKP